MLVEVRKAKRAGGKVPKKVINRYKKPYILKALKEMYGPYCCYCEQRVTTVGFQHIEHRMPKAPDKFPERTFEWDNLHLACERCNNEKSNKWDATNAILDAVTDVPIAQHLSYELYFRRPVTARGRTTYEHTNLDRDPDSGLLYARGEVWKRAMTLIEQIVRDRGAPAVSTVRNQLLRMCKDEFGSMMRHLMDIHGI
ncbi:MAG: HNH endonuclease [Phycisphaerae bacterium]